MIDLPPPGTEPIPQQDDGVAPTADGGPAAPVAGDGAAAVRVGDEGAVAPRPERRSLAVMLLLAVVGAGVVLLAAGGTWAHGSVVFQSTPLKVSVSGSEVSGLPRALGLVALASAVAVFAVRGRGRIAVGVLMALSGVGVAASALSAATGDSALDDKAARSVGLTKAVVTGVGHSGWPWLSVFGGVVLVLAGLVVVVRGKNWPGMSSRYDAPGSDARSAAAASARRAAPDPESPADLWKALDRGEDPTS